MRTVDMTSVSRPLPPSPAANRPRSTLAEKAEVASEALRRECQKLESNEREEDESEEEFRAEDLHAGVKDRDVVQDDRNRVNRKADARERKSDGLGEEAQGGGEDGHEEEETSGLSSKYTARCLEFQQADASESKGESVGERTGDDGVGIDQAEVAVVSSPARVSSNSSNQGESVDDNQEEKRDDKLQGHGNDDRAEDSEDEDMDKIVDGDKEEADLKLKEEVSIKQARVSEYERRRLERIAANAKFLQRLGMKSSKMVIGAPKAGGGPKQARPGRKRKRASLGTDEDSSSELRRSSRIQKTDDSPQKPDSEPKLPLKTTDSPQPPNPARKLPRWLQKLTESPSKPKRARKLPPKTTDSLPNPISVQTSPQKSTESFQKPSPVKKSPQKSSKSLPKPSSALKSPEKISSSPKKPRSARKLSPKTSDSPQNVGESSQNVSQQKESPRKVSLDEQSQNISESEELPRKFFVLEPQKPIKQRIARKKKIPLALRDLGRSDESEEDEDIPPPFYGASDVERYSCEEPEPNADCFAKNTDSNRDILGFSVKDRSFAPPMFDPKLKKIYATTFSPFAINCLYVAGGYQGQVSVYVASRQPVSTTGNVLDQAPVLSFKAHNGWISGVSLAKSVHTNLLITASNDSFVKLWDLNKMDYTGRRPKCLGETNELHTSGIFGMDVQDDYVATCSKDGSVVISAFQDGNGFLRASNHYTNLGDVVKSVSFSRENPNEFVAGGNDRVLRVFDVSVKDRAVLEIPDAHERPISSVQFHPTDGNLIVSAGLDPNIHMFDVRKVSSPLFTFRGHSSQQSCIYHPTFIDDGRAIAAAAGSQCRAISLYSTKDGSTISRGIINHRADELVADPFLDRLLVVSGGVTTPYGFKWKL